MYAEQYYDRCCYGDFDPLTFVRFLLIHYRMDELRDCMERKQDAAYELAYYVEHPDEDADGKDSALMREVIQEADDEIKELYQEYTETADADAEPFDKAMHGVSVFLEAMKGR